MASNANPTYGISQVPATGFRFGHSPSVRPRDILAANLIALMQQRADLDRLPKLTRATGISNGTLDRWRRAAVSAGVDELQPLADAFGVPVWELLVPPEERDALRSLRSALKSAVAKK